MKLSTGKVSFPIEFDNGDKDVIYFNPNDPDLIVRMKNLQKRVNEKISGFEDVQLEADGTPTQMEAVESFEKMQNIIKDELDYAFGNSVSDVVFKHCSPFAIVDGEYFVVQFITAITPEIEKHVKKAQADVEKKMKKHIGKYAK